MKNFTFYNPTKILFGKGEIANIKDNIPDNTKIMMIYGGGSIKRNGVYQQVMSALADFEVIEFSGIEANPEYETLMRAVKTANQNQVTFLLAVGGGSVIDGTKFIAAAMHFTGEPWDILTEQAPIEKVTLFGAVLTLPATGSEMNGTSVVSRAKLNVKRAFKHSLVHPVFSVLDPETTFSLPSRQIGNGIVDAFTHVMEQYLTYPADAPLQDRFAESILQTLIIEGPKTYQDPNDYDARANMMWCATMALNGLIGCGVPSDWATHMIGHELTAQHGLDHAQTLAIILPSMMQYKKQQKREKLIQYAKRVWQIEEGSDDDKIIIAIKKTRDFFESVGVKTYLKDYQLSEAIVTNIVDALKQHGLIALGEHADIKLEDSEKILKMSA